MINIYLIHLFDLAPCSSITVVIIMLKIINYAKDFRGDFILFEKILYYFIEEFDYFL